MFSARTHNELIEAKDVMKADGPFFCLGCDADVRLKKGPVKAPHFAHMLDEGCRYGHDEGHLHQRLKDEICSVLSTYSEICDLKQGEDCKYVFPDISFRWRGKQRIALEIHVHLLSIRTIQRRIEHYTQQGFALLWIRPWNEALMTGGRYRLTRWERYLHELYRGKLFYWGPQGMLQPISSRPLSQAVDTISPYKSTPGWDGIESLRSSNRPHQVHLYPQITFADLDVITYPAWQGEHMRLPKARLWTVRSKRYDATHETWKNVL